ncbi:CHAP domain-containing protein [Bifidobacteriaceae bacterium NR021]|nr:CHAP domain-containing protein [Bifidobacteriaceae bacterium NR021]
MSEDRHSMYVIRRTNTVVSLIVAISMMFAGVAGTLFNASTASAVNMKEYRRKIQRNENLKRQLAGVNKQLANKIIELNDLNEHKIPNQIRAAQQAEEQASQARSLVESTQQRLESAQKDKRDLEEKIKKTGEDFDDAKAAVAQLARKSFHGSQASNVMNIVTKSTTTEQFVGKLQSEAAVARSEANAANDAAIKLNTSMNRRQRLAAIEAEIAKLKQQADAQAQSAQIAAKAANDRKKSLQSLRDHGEEIRKQLESQKSSLTSQSAREAAEIIAMKSAIDAQARALANKSFAKADPNAGNRQQLNGSSGKNVYLPPMQLSNGAANGMNYTVPGNCAEGSKFCYGHNTGNTVGGSAYPSRQCTLWAYLRRSQLGLPVGSYMGNGAEWANTGRRLGYLVNRTPHVGAVMVFARGQRVGNWNADWQYGHVAVVERVNADGSVLISEGGTGFSTFPAYETIYNPGDYEYVHY